MSVSLFSVQHIFSLSLSVLCSTHILSLSLCLCYPSTLPYSVHITSFFIVHTHVIVHVGFFFCCPRDFFVVAYFIPFTLRAKVGITGGVGSRLIKWRVLFYYLDLCSGSTDCWCIAYAVGKHHLSNVYTVLF